jgi:hypothetical protein
VYGYVVFSHETLSFRAGYISLSSVSLKKFGKEGNLQQGWPSDGDSQRQAYRVGGSAIRCLTRWF